MFGEVFLAIIHVRLDRVTTWLPVGGTDCGKTQGRTGEATAHSQGGAAVRGKVRSRVAEEKAQSQGVQAQDHITC